MLRTKFSGSGDVRAPSEITVTSMVPTFIRYQPLVCLPASGAAACAVLPDIDDAATAAAVPAKKCPAIEFDHGVSPLIVAASSAQSGGGNWRKSIPAGSKKEGRHS